ncbi:fumarylacetoacetate hydrolase family protein [Wenzhouxiangella marina]|uniref:Fumarylacetoacetate hydrolase n=1 Tax=Wenzhouxiangella marina TaxID=1579979 RepID=A0A0K0XVZ5_9GAMM|nr:fumarylacetoacetate hydrolase family protein [Wenzhouxiangella marina]AKS41879.1 Fumarylacetoacetate hydrolase [Wenzhouxiangella marina]MBB6086355.1 fumarylpyruvate hydrolase [Wenzhouxiangella marina]
MSADLRWTPPEVLDQDGRAYALRHVWCVGRNYAEHAREMGVDPSRSTPVFFSKPAQAVIQSGIVTYPERTEDLHHEVELVVLLARGGRSLAAADWPERIWGYAVGVDLTRRDLQAKFKQAGQPWELSKGFDESAPVGSIVPAERWQPRSDCMIRLSVNGESRQHARLGEMIWSVAELLERLSHEVQLNSGDVVFTGTPAGVASLQRGDRVQAEIEGLPVLEFDVT